VLCAAIRVNLCHFRFRHGFAAKNAIEKCGKSTLRR
jgi:hypothetical protein